MLFTVQNPILTHQFMLNEYKCLLVFQGDEYKGKESDAFELFKLCHYSKIKKGYTPAVQLAIVSQRSNGALY
jgi:hypothetical protein